LPRPWALRAGAAIGRLLYTVDARDRATALRNLAIAFPERSAAERVAILQASCRNLGRVGAEICHLSRLAPASLERYVGFADRAGWEQIITGGGLILTGHFGNWELLAYAQGLLGHPITLVHRPMRNPLVDRAIIDLRAGAGTRALAKRAAARDIIRAVRAKQIVAIPIDQNQSANLGVFVDFFGTPACTTFGLARLALLMHCPVYPVFMVREGESDRHLIHTGPAVDLIDTGDRDADIVANTQRYTAIMEAMIRAHPEQWIWFHKRWRTRPPGEAQFY
jgi:KDO2-lipid IV(A) lauroyltransferase